MLKEIITAGKNVTEAKENAFAALGVSAEDDVQFEIVDLGTKGIFGIGARPTKVRAFIEIPDAPDRRSREAKPAEETPTAANEGAPRQEGSRRNRNRRGRDNRRDGGRGGRESNARRQAEIEEAVRDAKSKPNAARSVVIPENELTFEKIEVAPGEDRTYDFVTTLVANMDLGATVELFRCSDGTRRITISGEKASLLIGHHGDTLEALQHLTNLAGSQKNADGERNKSRVTVDIEGYRAKREETLRSLARRMAAKALKNQRSVMLEPMSPYERRIIHSEVQSIEGVATNSVGSDSNRKIVIYLTDKKSATPQDADETEAPAEAAAETMTEVTAAPEQTAADTSIDE